MFAKALFAACALTLALVAPALAQSSIKSSSGRELLDTYVAYISRNDLVNSNGAKLSAPWQVLRQDRANFHALGKADPQDQYDIFFSDKDNRAVMEGWLRAGAISPSASKAIMAGNVEVFVQIYGRNGLGEAIEVTVNR